MDKEQTLNEEVIKRQEILENYDIWHTFWFIQNNVVSR